MNLILIFFICYLSLISQRIIAHVVIDAPRLTASQKDDIKGLDKQIETYINDYKWISGSDDTPIDCKVSIIIESVLENGGAKIYKAQFLINSISDENFYDKQMGFKYKINENLKRNSNEYESLPAFLDFYINMVCAGEMDTFEPLGGDSYYNKARTSVTTGAQSSDASDWKFREELILDATNAFSKSVRKAKLLLYTAQNYYEEKKYKECNKTLLEILDLLKETSRNKPTSLILKRFFEGNTKRILNIIDAETQQAMIKDLINLDPVRRETYRKYLKYQED